MAAGLGFGQSTIAGIVTRGIVEMQRLCEKKGGKVQTLNGLSGVGDLMLTCFSTLSRNNRLGRHLTKDKLSIKEACEKIGGVVEGVPTAQIVLKWIEKDKLNMPLFTAVGQILTGKISPK